MSLELLSALLGSTPASPTPPIGYLLGPGEIFTLFFVTLGPLKLLAPFAKYTRGLDKASLRRLALRAIAIAAVAVFAGGLLGMKLLASWHVPTEVVLLAAGLVLLLVALRLVLEGYGPSPAEPAAPQAAPSPFLIAFPGIVTPYGIAIVIALLAASTDAGRTAMILGVLAGVLVLDLLAMLFDHTILRTVGWLLHILGAVLGVMQVALAIQIMLVALRYLGLLSPLGS